MHACHDLQVLYRLFELPRIQRMRTLSVETVTLQIYTRYSLSQVDFVSSARQAVWGRQPPQWSLHTAMSSLSIVYSGFRQKHVLAQRILSALLRRRSTLRQMGPFKTRNGWWN